jgi:protease II
MSHKKSRSKSKQIRPPILKQKPEVLYHNRIDPYYYVRTTSDEIMNHLVLENKYTYGCCSW